MTKALSNPFQLTVAESTLPAWVASLPLWQWHQIPNTKLNDTPPTINVAGSPYAKIDAWNGATLRRQGSIYMLGAAGGHGDYAGNEVNALALNTETPQWQEVAPPSPTDQIITHSVVYLDGRPSSRHTYWSTQFIDSMDRMLIFRTQGMSTQALPMPPEGWLWGEFKYVMSFNWETKQWDSPDYITPTPSPRFVGSQAMCFKDPITEDVYYTPNGTLGTGEPITNRGWYKWTKATNTWSRDGSAYYEYAAGAMDPVRGRVLAVGGWGTVGPRMLNLATGANLGLTFTNPELITDTSNTYPGVFWDETLEKFIVVRNASGGSVITVHVVDPETLVVSDPGMTGTPPAKRVNGIHNACQYVPELKGFVICTGYYDDVWFVRTSL